MRYHRLVGSALAVAATASACVTTRTWDPSYDVSPPPDATTLRIAEYTAERDSLAAQSIADREGPGASITAEITGVNAGSRHVRAHFHVDNDAYVVVGQVDAGGILRIVFPTEPGDDGFVRGDHSYQTTEFLAGFNSDYRQQAQNYGALRSYDVSRNAYDGGTGYVFVVASWRPMHFDRFMTDGRWDSYELAEDQYVHDPRPGIQELASLLVGDSREAYTLEYAQYYNTLTYADAYDSFDPFGYGDGAGLGFCSGFAPLGFASNPFRGAYSPFNPLSSYGSTIDYRGSRYFYNAVGDCYTGGGYGFPGFGGYGGYGFGFIAQGPFTPPVTRRGGFNLGSYKRGPTPEPLPGHGSPLLPVLPGGAAQTTAHFSPEYRQRGLITSDDPSSRAAGSVPRVNARVAGDTHSRPSLQEMTSRRAENTHDGVPANALSAVAGHSNGGGSMGQTWRPQQQHAEQEAQSRARAQANASAGGAAYQHAGQRSGSSESTHSAPPPRAEPTHSYTPPAAPAARSAPPPASSSSSGSKPPIK